MFPVAARIPGLSFQTKLPPANCPTVPLLSLPESRLRQKILETPARPYPDCRLQPRWPQVRDRKRGAPKPAQFSAGGRKAAAVRQDPTQWCRSLRLPLAARTTARNPAGRRGQRLLAAENGHATPDRRRLLSAT